MAAVVASVVLAAAAIIAATVPGAVVSVMAVPAVVAASEALHPVSLLVHVLYQMSKMDGFRTAKKSSVICDRNQSASDRWWRDGRETFQ